MSFVTQVTFLVLTHHVRPVPPTQDDTEAELRPHGQPRGTHALEGVSGRSQGQPLGCPRSPHPNHAPGSLKGLCLQQQKDSWKGRRRPLILVALTSEPLTRVQDLWFPSCTALGKSLSLSGVVFLSGKW